MTSLARIWSARRTTIAFAVLYVAWLARGLLIGWQEVYDPEVADQAVLHFHSTREARIDVEGRAQRLALRRYHQRATLFGDSRIRVRGPEDQPRSLAFQIEPDGALPGDEIVFVIEQTGERHFLRELHHYRIEATLPLFAHELTIRVEPSRPGLRYRFRRVELVERGDPAQGLQARAVERQLLEGPHAKVRLGAGFWDEFPDAPIPLDQPVFSRQSLFLLVEPKRPGRHRIDMTIRRTSPHYPPPQIFVDGAPTTVSLFTKLPTDWEVATFEAELGASSVLCIALPVLVKSPLQSRSGEDIRRLGYGLLPNELVVTPLF
jgi:hypothetical protein